MTTELRSLSRLGVARGVALFLGLFTLWNVAGEWLSPSFATHVWWIDARWIPSALREPLAAAAGLVLGVWSLFPRGTPGWRRLVVGTLTALSLTAIANAAVFFLLWARGEIQPGLPIPASAFLAWLLGWMTVSARRAHDSCPESRSHSAVGMSVGLVACTVGLPLVQVFWFGNTDYRAPADGIVVFGARTYADGRPSDALADRVRTGCELFHAGYAPRLILSGGPGDGPVHEVEAMRGLAIKLGVPEEAILLDYQGWNTRRTIAGLRQLPGLPSGRFLGVSHFYHLARIRLAGQRAGVEIRTVPARQAYFLRQIPYSVAREVAALWAYQVRPG